MQVILLLLFLAAVTVLTLLGTLTISFLMGVVLSRFPKAKAIAPIFFIAVPASAIGALAGGIGIGYLAIRYNEHLIFLGPMGGIIIGGVVGLTVGTGVAGIWWLRRSKILQNTPPGMEKLCHGASRYV